jgi:thiamine pyrophosphate-dependent acetolactate synthase large subunit-like protein
MQQLSKLNNVDIFVAGSSGGSAEASFLNFKNKNNKFINSPGLGSMGFALPSIVGAISENSKKNVIYILVS